MTRTTNRTTANSTLLNGSRVSTTAVVAQLNTLGFTKYEAVAYLLLLEHQPAWTRFVETTRAFLDS